MQLHRHPLFLWVLALAAIAGFASLGFWQLDRAAQKRGMLARAQSALASHAARPIAVALDPARADGYDRVDVAGRFIDAPALLLDNQQREGRAGVRVYRLFQSGAGPVLLVELGWVALPPDRRLPAVARTTETRRLRGLLLPFPRGGLDMGAPSPQAGGDLLATTLTHAQARAALAQPALALRVLRPAPDPAFGYTRDFEILPNTLPPERHVGYAVQWFGLSVTVFITALLLTLRMRRRRVAASV